MGFCLVFAVLVCPWGGDFASISSSHTISKINTTIFQGCFEDKRIYVKAWYITSAKINAFISPVLRNFCRNKKDLDIKSLVLPSVGLYKYQKKDKEVN